LALNRGRKNTTVGKREPKKECNCGKKNKKMVSTKKKKAKKKEK